MPPRATDHQVDWRIAARPIGQVNWTGMWTLYLREVRRFFKMLLQAVLAPIVTCLLFLAIFTIAFGDGRDRRWPLVGEIRPSIDGHEFRDHAARLSVGHV